MVTSPSWPALVNFLQRMNRKKPERKGLGCIMGYSVDRGRDLDVEVIRDTFSKKKLLHVLWVS